ncbi:MULTISPECIES: YqcI/YcgG family protein [Pontibacillus]|uniref:YqcI/YcgG family protein n=1 Tax=Pontibacillus chungwhensis TaxID=265426 RepID=A0ABY8UY92_9BACI|nr:YqcI/YcgG family protein [Pontibacillus chungwhensis]WIF97484.1 YqcI/YcgG family protein [Pontibacillus chungwhensis]
MSLYTKSLIEEQFTELEEWQREAYHDFTSMMLSTEHPYPCVPGKQGFVGDMLRFGFCPSPKDEDAARVIASLLKEYGTISRDTGMYASLVLLCDTRELLETHTSVYEYEQCFWKVLSVVHQLDDAPWPEHIPQDPHDPSWEFCFDGEPYFAFCATPAHVSRKSRYSSNFLIAFQPRWVFDEINASTSLGQKLKKVIRKRLVDYDGIKAHPSLMWYGQEENYEWKQYFLHDDDSTLSKCPFMRMKSKWKSLRS